MIARIFILMCFVFATSGCNGEEKYTSTKSPISVASNKNVETAIESFSMAVSKKDVNIFVSLADPKGVHLVRKFTSGNLGGRGPELSMLTDPKSINEDLEFPVKKQTSYSVPFQFQDLPFKSFAALPQYPLSADVDATDFDQWEPILKSSLKGAAEVSDGSSLLLVSPKYWVYTEAQIIDDILVGGFAVFAMVDGKLQLVALIDLL